MKLTHCDGLTETVGGPETDFLEVEKDIRSEICRNQPIYFDETAQNCYKTGDPFVYTANANMTSLKKTVNRRFSQYSSQILVRQA